MYGAAFKKIAVVALAGALAMAFGACHRINDDRIPVVSVNIIFPTVAQWDVYGVAGAMDYERFIIDERLPRNFPYTAISATGYGGILLVSDVLGEAKAYDLACPVECKRDIRVAIDTETMLARCPVCGSEYDVFSLLGHPVSGPAAADGYGLRRYYVGPGRDGSYRQICY